MTGTPAADVLAIGGGFAGVTAARALSAAGYFVHLVEARDRLCPTSTVREAAGDNRCANGAISTASCTTSRHQSMGSHHMGRRCGDS
ncbi:NAD(P)-binding protein [Streptomyces sp. NPDC001714]|uniref:NAD(P)-binding protein n=1 Tax=Streptomyces sp. NPDC001714 TaxID=3364603 RepID=UPI0036B4B438